MHNILIIVFFFTDSLASSIKGRGVLSNYNNLISKIKNKIKWKYTWLFKRHTSANNKQTLAAKTSPDIITYKKYISQYNKVIIRGCNNIKWYRNVLKTKPLLLALQNKCWPINPFFGNFKQIFNKRNQIFKNYSVKLWWYLRISKIFGIGYLKLSDREFGLEVDNISFSQNIHVTKQNIYRIAKGKQNSLPKIILVENLSLSLKKVLT